MQSFCDAFRRTEDGSWVCVQPAAIQGPGSRMEAAPGDICTPGTDLADFLEVENAVRNQAAQAITRRRSRHEPRRLA